MWRCYLWRLQGSACGALPLSMCQISTEVAGMLGEAAVQQWLEEAKHNGTILRCRLQTGNTAGDATAKGYIETGVGEILFEQVLLRCAFSPYLQCVFGQQVNWQLSRCAIHMGIKTRAGGPHVADFPYLYCIALGQGDLWYWLTGLQRWLGTDKELVKEIQSLSPRGKKMLPIWLGLKLTPRITVVEEILGCANNEAN